MSFYSRRPPAMGFVWLAPVVQLVGGALQSHPVGGTYIKPPPAQNSAVTVVATIGGLAVVGGLFYLVWTDTKRGAQRKV